MDMTTTTIAPTAKHIHKYVKDGSHLSCWCGKRMYQRDGGYTTDYIPQSGVKVKCPDCQYEFEISVKEVRR